MCLGAAMGSRMRGGWVFFRVPATHCFLFSWLMSWIPRWEMGGEACVGVACWREVGCGS